jgi:hypothetical protein
MISFTDKLDDVLRSRVGNHRGMVNDLRSVVLELHARLVEQVQERNTALRDVLANFGVDQRRLKILARRLANGEDGSKIAGFDEMSQYAQQHHPQLLCRQHGECDSETADGDFAKVLVEGFRREPKPWDAEVVELAISYVGADFFASYDGDYQPVLGDRSTERKIRFLEKYSDGMRDDQRAGLETSKLMYKLRRLRSAIGYLPAEYQSAAVARCRYVDLATGIVNEYLAVPGAVTFGPR